MRAVSNALVAMLIVAALFWGNCFSCPQVLQALQSKQAAHGCCHGTKHGSTHCQTEVLRHFVKAESADRAVPANAFVRAVLPVAPALTADPGCVVAVPAGPAPPDLAQLSILRV